jgi:hypothetical protein
LGVVRPGFVTPGANLETTWSYLNNLGDRRLSAISNKGLAARHFTDFAFTTSPENLITGIRRIRLVCFLGLHLKQRNASATPVRRTILPSSQLVIFLFEQVTVGDVDEWL